MYLHCFFLWSGRGGVAIPIEHVPIVMSQRQLSASRGDVAVDVGALPETVDRAAIKRMGRVATLLDESIRVPGTRYRVGLDPLLGVAPVAGDVLAGALSMYIVLEAARLGVSYMTLLRMIGNISIDIVGGSIPLLGDVFDAVWKANRRNVDLVLEDLMTGS